MNSLPNELIIEIFNHIQKITDKRQFLKTCKIYNNLTKQSFTIYETNYKIKKFIKPTDYCVEKFTLELCHDKYFDMIPKSYINENNTIIIKALASFNCIKLLDLALENGCYATQDKHLKIINTYDTICEHAASNDQLEILEWAINKKEFCNVMLSNKQSCAFAAFYGHFEILKWLREKGFKWDKVTCIFAAMGGRLEILKWVMDNGCEWDKAAYWNAKGNGHKEVVKWIEETGYYIK